MKVVDPLYGKSPAQAGLDAVRKLNMLTDAERAKDAVEAMKIIAAEEASDNE